MCKTYNKLCIFLGFILKLPIYGAPPDTLCFEDAVYWEVHDLLYNS